MLNTPSTKLPTPKSQRNAALDVLRALAIVVVVNCHVATGFCDESTTKLVLGLGGVGVQLFFVLSGWLLGHQLCMELRRTGTIEIRRFWYRRWMRTLPAYYAVLAFTYLWQILLKNNYDLCWSFLFFGQNYLIEIPYFEVSWSLCVEEHFYLLVAPTLLLLYRWRSLAVGLCCLLLLPSVFRYCGWFFQSYETHVSYAPCVVGVGLSALAVFAPRSWAILTKLAPWLASAGVAACALNVLHRMHLGPMQSDWSVLSWGLIFGSLVLLATTNDWFIRYCRVPGARYLADRSYAVYLLHAEALAIVGKIPGLPFPCQILLTWVFSLAFAELLYRGIERPFMQLRERFSAMRSSSSMSEPAQAQLPESRHSAGQPGQLAFALGHPSGKP